MNASEIFSGIFGLIIRCAGLSLTLLGINDIYRALIMFVQVVSITSFIPFLFGIPCLLIGVWFLRGAQQLMSFSYPQYKIKEK